MILIICPHCDRRLRIPDRYEGARGRCNFCGGTITVPKQSFYLQEDDVAEPSSSPSVDYQALSEDLLLAAGKRDKAKVEQLLAAGASADCSDSYGITPLYTAAHAGQAEVVAVLLAGGAVANMAGSDGRTPLHAAASRGHLEVAKLLVGHGADVNARDGEGHTPLHDAACATIQAEEVVTGLAGLLLKQGADVNARDNLGETPTRKAVEHGHPGVAQLLEKNGGTAKDWEAEA